MPRAVVGVDGTPQEMWEGFSCMFFCCRCFQFSVASQSMRLRHSQHPVPRDKYRTNPNLSAKWLDQHPRRLSLKTIQGFKPSEVINQHDHRSPCSTMRTPKDSSIVLKELCQYLQGGYRNGTPFANVWGRLLAMSSISKGCLLRWNGRMRVSDIACWRSLWRKKECSEATFCSVDVLMISTILCWPLRRGANWM